MKSSLFWKRFDLYGQLVMALPILGFALDEPPVSGFYSLFTVGIWQTVSCSTHFIVGRSGWTFVRQAYSILLAVVLFIFIGLIILHYFAGRSLYESFLHNLAMDARILFLTVMIIAGPCMAIWYFCITVSELSIMKKAAQHRTEVHWKL